MKRNVLGLILGLSALGAMAQEAAVELNTDSATPVAPAAAVVAVPTVGAAALPEGVTTEQHPLKKAYIESKGSKLVPIVFRPSDNMPEIVDEELLRGIVESGKTPSKTPASSARVIGYLPKLTVLPCTVGCEGKDYDKAVKEFLKGYHADARYIKPRGEMIVQVRWFNVRPFLMRQLPYKSDLFGVSFILEGKLVSLGAKSGAGISVSAHELARDMGARLAFEMLFTMGVGTKPTFLTPVSTDVWGGIGNAIVATNVAMNSAMAVEDVRSRIEPATAAHAHLLPAIDGIKPGEVAPIDKMSYLNSLWF